MYLVKYKCVENRCENKRNLVYESKVFRTLGLWDLFTLDIYYLLNDI